MLEAARIAHSAGRTVAFTLSESLCIGDRREGVLGMVDAGLVDILFGNEHEIRHLTGCGAIERLHRLARRQGRDAGHHDGRRRSAGFGTRPGFRSHRPRRCSQVVDTTGAGDLFAAGFLAARCRERSVDGLPEAGSIAAAEVISHFGARPEADLRQLVAL